ncbi:MAG: DUF4145 domain-containing protein [Hydrogenophaga sp.]|nr:DUF4145 domain-containing protein [Hydrogenophaga sp.]
MNPLSKEALLVLDQLLEACEAGDGTVLAARFRADHSDHLSLLDQLARDQYIQNDRERYRVGVIALPQINMSAAKGLMEQAERLWEGLRKHYKAHLGAQMPVADLAMACDMTLGAAHHTLRYMVDVPWHGGYSGGGDKPIESIAASETVLKHASFLSVIEEVRLWNSIGPLFGNAPSHATVSLTEPPHTFKQSVPAPPHWLTKLPGPAQLLMREVHLAMAAELYALSAMGIRAVVDVISFDLLAVDAGTFNAKLVGLAKAGHLSPSQHNALSAVVDAGNAAAHRGFSPTQDAAQAMLDALEVVLKSAYVLPGAAQSLQAMTPKRPPKSRV